MTDFTFQSMFLTHLQKICENSTLTCVDKFLCEQYLGVLLN